MIRLEVQPKELNLNEFKKRTALEKDCSRIMRDECIITTNSIPRILYCKINADTSALRWAVQSIKYETSDRTAGLKSTSAIFGFSPKNALRKDFCSSTAMSRNFPKQHFVICEFSKELTKLYEKYFPETLHRHYQIADKKIRNEWKLEGTPFTSGIVNKNNPLKYHHDAGNFKDVLSNMIVLKRGVNGGRLSCPEYDIRFECDDNYVVIFDGAEILHGVTPILFNESDPSKNSESSTDISISYRYSVVYYSLEQMWNCDSINDELQRIRSVKKQRELKRINPSS